MFKGINFVEIFSSFIVMAAIIDIFGPIPIFILRKFFGVIVLAIAVNMFVNNISVIISNVTKYKSLSSHPL